MRYTNRIIESLDWVTLIMVGCIVVIAILKVIYPKRFEDFIRLPVSNNYFLAKGKSEELRHPFSILLFLIQLISISLFVYLFFLEKGKATVLLFFQILSAVFIFIIVKTSIEKMIGAIFSIKNIIDQYIYEKLSYRNFISLLLIIANLIFYFSVKPDLNTLLIFTGILFLINILILFYSYKKYRSLIFSNFFYFLLYICALEISPYLILYKAFI
ncbi:MAG: DUF4271 domain-containing protein [Flavobacteriaceae bacterium]|nr:DUF4271 domain-containing protein [Flavobacteriaceae bacterium]